MLLQGKRPDGSDLTVRLKSIGVAKPVTLGRGDDADVTLDDAGASRIHAAIRYWDDIFVIRDMNSRNGTLLNGNQIDVAKLNPGDVIRIGDTELTAFSEGMPTDVTINTRG